MGLEALGDEVTSVNAGFFYVLESESSAQKRLFRGDFDFKY